MGYPSHPTVSILALEPAILDVVASVQRDPNGLAAALASGTVKGPGQLCVTLWVFDSTRESVALVAHRSLGWSVPGGHLIAGEHPWAAARRELLEETGLVLPVEGPRPAFVHTATVGTAAAGPAHTHWSIGYVAVTDGRPTLWGEPDQAARWASRDFLPRPHPDDLGPLLALTGDVEAAVIEAAGPD